MFSSSAIDAVPSRHGRHTSLLSLFMGAVEAKQSTWVSRGAALAQLLGEEDGANGR